ncbi:uncharacterized protein LOC124412245 [Diprion similis]|uniref:uncharacterized protein LOC124412245 n=1 Tax=Diprion similis TaxID=362088 RepID=UPI001EF81CB9|nr:uncharacterized protein LOC124412245 [Diprion similis]
MDSEVNVSRSLPPLVEGKLHGYLNLTVDEIVWSRRSPGDVTILASWWGELDSAQFRPVDIKTGSQKLDEDTTETYAVRTSVDLFAEYLKNCGTIELVVVAENTHQVIATAHVTDLLDIFESKRYSRYFPILNEAGNRLGDVHIGLKFTNMTKGIKTARKIKQFQKTQFEDQASHPVINLKPRVNDEKLQKSNKMIFDNKSSNALAMSNSKYMDNIYKSVLKDKRMESEMPLKKFNTEVADKLVAQVVARAQRLRGAILKETCSDDRLALSESSALDSPTFDNSIENEAKLYEYFLGKRMSQLDERKALETLRSTSPTPSLINLASETIQSCYNCQQRCNQRKIVMNKPQEVVDEIISKDSESYKSRESSPLDHIDSMKIVVESLTLSPPGYRRVRSSCVSRGDSIPLAVTYLVEYDTSFTKKPNRKSSSESRPTKLCSKKQVGQVIYFNHQAIFDLPKPYIHMDVPLKFKVFNRHLNQRSPTLLGFGSIYVSEVAEMETLSTTQKLAIVNKGIKMGELKVHLELGCDGIHFGKDFIDAVTSTKQNIPVYEISSVPSTTGSKAKSATGSNSKPNSRVSTSSKYSYSCSGSKSSGSNKNGVTENRQSNTEDRYVKVDQPSENKEEKTLLHGLIYIAEGKGLPKLNTYLICRAFWKEDRATSQLCNDTENPFYHFHELVPLLHGQELLDRTKDNFIVTEVWSRNISGQDNLLGIAKLPVHQLYVAYRDSLVVPHLLLSKYPVISVDGWVPISEPVTGRSCGELLALVALGTADQIALLEMTRGLRDCNITPCVIQSSLRNASQNTEKSNMSTGESQVVNQRIQLRHENPHTSTDFLQGFDSGFQHFHTEEIYSAPQDKKTQESQTEITTVEDMKSFDTLNREVQNDPSGSQSSVLHALVDHLAQALNVPKVSSHTATEVHTVQPNDCKLSNIVEQIDLEPLSNDSISSLESSPRDNYGMPTEMYRSVGVGAEYDDTVNQVPSTSYSNPNPKPLITEKSVTRDDLRNMMIHIDEESSFRAHVEIECALHLPKVEKIEGAVEPSTYVTFQPVEQDNGTEFGSYKITNIFPNSCSPKWEWRCDTRLSSDLLVNEQKRMILKIWRLSDPMTNSNFDLNRDIVIGFAAVDLSILLAGFPLVSGWFHIMDFTGKCNGQIKVTITPLENISMFTKSTSSTSIPHQQISQLTASYIPQNTGVLSETFLPPVEQISQNHTITNNDGFCTSYSQLENDPGNDIGHSLGDVSMTFLSQSLKQKLTELDEITKRLKSRLHDVTNEDFDVDFDPDFDADEPDLELAHHQNGNTVNDHSVRVAPRNVEDWQPLPQATNNLSSQCSQTNRYRDSNFFIDIHNRYVPNNYNTNTESTDPNLTDTGYSTNSHVRSRQSFSNGHFDGGNRHGDYSNNCYVRDEVAEQPTRGARMHINHLLDKLTSLTSAPPPAGNFPIKRNIHDFIASLRQNNTHTNRKCNQEVNMRTVPTQTEHQDIQRTETYKNQTPSSINLQLNVVTRDVNENNNVADTTVSNITHERNKVSTMIREELVAEENDDFTEFDELTTHLLTSNVRHMDSDSTFNPLLYQQLIPNVHVSDSFSNPNNSNEDVENLNATNDGVVIEELDNRYAETFNATINSGLGRLRNLIEIDTSLVTDGVSQHRVQANTSKSLEGNDFFRMTPTGVSDDTDENIDVTEADKLNSDDLMTSNSTESTTTLSLDTSSIKQRQGVVDSVSVMSSDSSVSVVTRQAPDGGNPTEETNKPLFISRLNESDNSSTDS